MPAPRVAPLALAADAVAVVVFAAVGRASHAGSDDLLGLVTTAAPFAVGLATAWATPLVRARPIGLRAGAAVLTCTAVLGLAIRAAFTGRLPLTFVGVTIVALAVLLLGWRGLAAVVSQRAAHRVR